MENETRKSNIKFEVKSIPPTVVPKTSKVILEVFLWHLLNEIFKKIQYVI
jgi:hypothetical protein